ncbi:uncharacterized protein LOC114240882 [Bombyx mandarina]|uniref:Uncharacterized protein LOC114240882 n=1 Tax=Bombyx mandarina TaxID=7092 RepID=A0A6J2JDG7_BOMMA|nr:uncharacterized protein LOC114240882 [Bombyx mandarina]
MEMLQLMWNNGNTRQLRACERVELLCGSSRTFNKLTFNASLSSRRRTHTKQRRQRAATAARSRETAPAARRTARGNRGPRASPRGGRQSPRGDAGSRPHHSDITTCPTEMPSTTSYSARYDASSSFLRYPTLLMLSDRPSSV